MALSRIRTIILLRRVARLDILLDYLVPSAITRILSVCYLTRRDVDIDIMSQRGRYIMSVERELLYNPSELYDYRDRNFEILFIGHDIPILKEYIWNSKTTLHQELNIWIAISYPRQSVDQFCNAISDAPAMFRLSRPQFEQLNIPWRSIDKSLSYADNFYAIGDVYSSIVSPSPHVNIVYMPGYGPSHIGISRRITHPSVQTSRQSLDNVTVSALNPVNFNVPYLKFKDSSWLILYAQYADSIIRPMNYSMRCYIKIPDVNDIAIVYFEF